MEPLLMRGVRIRDLNLSKSNHVVVEFKESA